MENIKAINKTPFFFQGKIITVNTRGTKTPKRGVSHLPSVVRKLAVSLASPGHMTLKIKFRLFVEMWIATQTQNKGWSYLFTV